MAPGACTYHSQHRKEDDHSQAGVGGVSTCVDIGVSLLIQLQHAQPSNHIHERRICNRGYATNSSHLFILSKANAPTTTNNRWHIRFKWEHKRSHQTGSWCSWDRRGSRHSASPPSSEQFPWRKTDQSALGYHIPEGNGDKNCLNN